MKDRKVYQRKYQEVYKRRNREKLEKYNSDYQTKNAEKLRKYNQDYYKENIKIDIKKKKEIKKDTRILEIIRNYYKNNQGYIDIEHEKRRETQKRYRRNRRLIIYNKYQGRCAYCGKRITFKNFIIEHMIPKKKQAINFVNSVNDNYSNLMPACDLCNRIKGNHNMRTFREKLFGREPYRFYFER